MDDESAELNERSEVEEELRQTRHFAETVINSVREGVIVYDTELRYVYWNDFMKEKLGVSLDQVRGRKAVEIFPKLAQEGIISMLERALQGETTRSEDRSWDLATMDEPVWVRGTYGPHRDPDGNIIGVVALIRDVTDLKRAEVNARKLAHEEFARLRAEEERERIQRLVDSIGDPFFAVDRQWTVVYANERAFEFWDANPEDILGKHLWESFPQAADTEAYERLCEANVHREPVDLEYVSPITGKWVEAHAYPFQDGLSVYLRDIELRKRAEKMRDQYERQLVDAKEQAEKVAQLRTSLLANMSHELRTPLTSMLLQIQLLEEQVEEGQRRRLESIEEAGFRLSETLSSVLTLSQLESGTLEPAAQRIDLADVVARTVTELEPLAQRKGLSLWTDPRKARVEVDSDPALLNRLITNLVGNAIKFTERGSVTVSLRVDDERAVLKVEDTGVGIEPHFLDEIFEAFKQESTGWSRSHEGTGLGLTISRKIVEALKGTIEVESKKGVGSTFTVTLPARQIEQDQPNTDELDQDVPATHAAPDVSSVDVVLVVEDNRAISDALVQLLERFAKVEAFTAAEPALKRAAAHEFAAVLMDISLPTMSGVEALAALRRIDGYADTPVIALTGHAMPGDRERFLQHGFDAYISKPFEADELLDALKSALI